MTADVVSARHLHKAFPSKERRWGRAVGTTEVLHDVSFGLPADSIVGFLGHNGAGKTTTLKILSGILAPTSGAVEVLGMEPAARRRELLRQISLVMGQRHRLVWDLPVAESFELQRVVYGLDRARARRHRDRLVEQLQLGELLDQPTRTLSLGQRMRCEIAVSLVHEPSVVFLDEPTLGLDVTMQEAIRTFLRDYRRDTRCSVLLTSHNMADVAELCDRVLLIEDGRLSYDGGLDSLRTLVAPFRKLVLDFSTTADRRSYAGVEGMTRAGVFEARVGVERIGAIVDHATADPEVRDVTVLDPTLDDVLALLFAGRQDRA